MASEAPEKFSDFLTFAEGPARAKKNMACVHFATAKATNLTCFMTLFNVVVVATTTNRYTKSHKIALVIIIINNNNSNINTIIVIVVASINSKMLPHASTAFIKYRIMDIIVSKWWKTSGIACTTTGQSNTRWWCLNIWRGITTWFDPYSIKCIVVVVVVEMVADKKGLHHRHYFYRHHKESQPQQGRHPSIVEVVVAVRVPSLHPPWNLVESIIMTRHRLGKNNDVNIRHHSHHHLLLLLHHHYLHSQHWIIHHHQMHHHHHHPCHTNANNIITPIIIIFVIILMFDTTSKY
jgi:hypothetical protein